jgi:peptidoglycan/LPS O-acetylase OafA/YrhL
MSLTRTSPAIATAAGRDHYLDLLRVASVAAIVFGHWFTAKVWRNGGRIGVDSILADIPQLRPASWLFMTVPVLLFVGGFANATVWSRCLAAAGPAGAPVREFLRRRGRRLVPPILVFAGVWAIVEIVLHVLDTGGDRLVRGVSYRGVLPFAPLWFMGVYFALVALCPITVALHARYGMAVPVALVAGCAAVDALRLVAQLPYVGWLNLLLAWSVAHQLGYFYADGSLAARPRRTGAMLAAAGLLGLLATAGSGLYPRSIGGVPDEAISNMRPPTVVIVALSVWQVGLVLMLAPWGRRLLRRGQAAAMMSRLNAVSMSLYLWHMTALLVVLLVCIPFGLARPEAPLADWWLQRPVWLVLGAVVLGGIVTAVGRVERAR